MPYPKVESVAAGIQVGTADWEILHSNTHGGCWSSVRMLNSGKELLRRPAGSFIRVLKQGSFSSYFECGEQSPALRVEQLPSGAPVVVAEGTYKGGADTIPVGYRRRTEYRDHGIIWSMLEIMSESGCPGVVQVCALELPLRTHFTECFARFHPTQAGTADLLGGRGWFPIPQVGDGTRHISFLSRFTPLQVTLTGVSRERFEIFPGSELAQWDSGLKPDMGLGQFQVGTTADETTVSLEPYNIAERRMPMTVKGNYKLRLGMSLPSGAQRKLRTAVLKTHWQGALDSGMAALADAGIQCLCFNHLEPREDGFWRAGVYPPYASEKMSELRGLIDSAHRHGLKVVPAISIREWHPSGAGFEKDSRKWMHAAPSLDLIHSWSGDGERGALMCLKSGWLENLKRHITQLLDDLPWDGLHLEWAGIMPCSHREHAGGSYHADTEELLELLAWCRTRCGDGLLCIQPENETLLAASNIASMSQVV